MGSRRSAVSGRTTSTVIERSRYSDMLSSPLLPGFGIGLRELFVA